MIVLLLKRKYLLWLASSTSGGVAAVPLVGPPAGTNHRMSAAPHEDDGTFERRRIVFPLTESTAPHGPESTRYPRTAGSPRGRRSVKSVIWPRVSTALRSITSDPPTTPDLGQTRLNILLFGRSNSAGFGTVTPTIGTLKRNELFTILHGKLNEGGANTSTNDSVFSTSLTL